MMTSNSIGQAILELEDPIVSRYMELGIAKTMTPAEMISVPGMTQVSNRTVYDRCLAWGCTITKTNGNWVWMQSPFLVRFKIRPPQQHAANSKFEFEKMLDAIMLPWSVFIGAEILDSKRLTEIGKDFTRRTGGIELSPRDDMGPCMFCEESVIRAVMVKRGKKIAHSWCAKQAAEAKNKPVDEPVDEIPTEEESETMPEAVPDIDETTTEPEEVPVATLPRGRYINQVFDLLVERGDPMSNHAVASALGITPAQAGSAMSQLTTQKIVTRVKTGVYQAKPGLIRKEGTLGLVLSGHVEQERVIGTVPPNYHPAPNERPGPGASVSFANVEHVSLEADGDEDEMLNELLDLMAPNGFKARHLPYIDAFKSCALALMREINSAE